ncbi:MAG: AraC family transcriptional regulator [Armatimonadetes bacterium]|nr:AraC family transcriptional regulator [Armatimonadota bacterium]MDW8027792.1 AraC family transcriptional regulator [Armatimonadota bacterium]
MANRNYLPNLPLVGEEGTWESIAELIRNGILPKIEAIGDKLFQSNMRSLPNDAQIVPIVSESWSRPRQDGTPQFVYLISGQGLMLVEGKMLALNAGQGFYLPKGVLYAPYLMLGDRIFSCEWLWFKVHPFGVVTLRSCLTPKAHYQSAHFIIAERRLADLFWEWEREQNQANADFRITKGLLMAFFGLLARSLPLLPSEGTLSNNDLPLSLQNALTALHRAYNKPITLNQLAGYCGVTPEYLCRLFRRYLGITPWQYLERIRLRVADYLLQETELSISDVAFLAGFNDLRHFQRLFKRAYGKTPNSVRNRKRIRQKPFLRVWS